MVRSGRWRHLPVLVAVAVLASACSGSDEPSAAPVSQSVGGSSEGLPDALGSAGFEVVDEPGAPGSGEGLELWSFQVENLVREVDEGGGYLGVQLDELVGSPGGLPFSYLLAGWVSSAPTPTAEAAAELMGDQHWEQAPSLVYPTAVLVLFVADAVEAGGVPAAPESGVGRLVSLAQEGVCSTLANWVSQALDFIFESLKVNADTDSFLGWLGTIWNAAVDLARWAVEGLIELLTAPVVAAITDALAIVGTLSMIGSFLKPWSIDVTPSNPQTRFAVGGESDISESFIAEVDTGIAVEWPASIVDCAGVAGLDLPDPSSAEDSKASWTTAGLPPLGGVTRNQNVIDSNNKATLDWITGREESDDGEDLSGLVSASISVVSEQIEELKSLITGLVSGQVGDTVGGMLSLLTDPIIDQLAELIQPSGTASVTVTFHDREEPDPSTEPTLGWEWFVIGRNINGHLDLQTKFRKYALIFLEFADGQDLDEQNPIYKVTAARILSADPTQTDTQGCTYSGTAAFAEYDASGFIESPKAGFVQFDVTDPNTLAYEGQLVSLEAPSQTVTHACPETESRDHGRGPHFWLDTADFSNNKSTVSLIGYEKEGWLIADGVRSGTGGYRDLAWFLASCRGQEEPFSCDNLSTMENEKLLEAIEGTIEAFSAGEAGAANALLGTGARAEAGDDS